MRKSIHAVVCGLFAVSALGGQTVHNVQVCDITGTDCFQYDSSRIGGLRFEDYRVTNPQVIQFDPTMRLKELAATGASNTSAICNTPPTFAGTPPSITFDKTSVVGQVYWVPVGPSDGNPFEFMDVQFKNFAASNGFTSPTFGFRMFRELNPAGAEYPQYKITIQPGNAGLQNIPDLQAPVAFLMDSSTKTATMAGSVPAASLLRGAIYGVFVNAQAVIDAAKFTTTVPAPAGITLWSQAEMSQLAAQGAPWIVAAQSFQLRLAHPISA